jgi:hypothetical protein
MTLCTTQAGNSLLSSLFRAVQHGCTTKQFLQLSAMKDNSTCFVVTLGRRCHTQPKHIENHPNLTTHTYERMQSNGIWLTLTPRSYIHQILHHTFLIHCAPPTTSACPTTNKHLLCAFDTESVPALVHLVNYFNTQLCCNPHTRYHLRWSHGENDNHVTLDEVGSVLQPGENSAAPSG